MLVAGLVSPVCLAGQQSQDDSQRASTERLLEAINQLDAPDYETREQAMMWIAAARRLDIDFRAILATADLSIEQRNRLLIAWHDRVVFRPRGALGVEQRWVPDDDSIYGSFEILSLLPDLPAREVLQLRDRITHFDGRRPISGEELREHVQSLEPGDVVKLTVERIVRDENGDAQRDDAGELLRETIEVDLPLGPLEKLVDRNGIPQLAMDAKAIARNTMRRQFRVFAPHAEMIRFSDGVNLNDMPTRSRMEEMVDQHNTIVFLKRQLDYIDQGRATYDDMLEQWDRMVQQVRSQINDPATTDAEREFLQLVVKRFYELTQPDRNVHGG